MHHPIYKNVHKQQTVTSLTDVYFRMTWFRPWRILLFFTAHKGVWLVPTPLCGRCLCKVRVSLQCNSVYQGLLTKKQLCHTNQAPQSTSEKDRRSGLQLLKSMLGGKDIPQSLQTSLHLVLCQHCIDIATIIYSYLPSMKEGKTCKEKQSHNSGNSHTST